jgi:hypothetical protein
MPIDQTPEKHGPKPMQAPRGAALWRGYLAAFVLAALLFGLTTQRGVSWQDSGVFQWRLRTFDLTGRMGLALSHPLLVVLGGAWAKVPVGPMAFRLNLLSAAFGGLAVANVVVLVRRLAPGRSAAAWLAGGTFALAHTPWWLATICESQALLAAIFTLELHVLVSLVRRPAVRSAALLGLVAGLGFSTHNLALLALPAYVGTAVWLCLRRRLRWVGLAQMGVGWLAGAALMLALVASKASADGWGAAIGSALFGQGWRGAVLGLPLRPAARGVGYVLYNFPNLALPLMAAGLWGLRRHLPGPVAAAMIYLAGAYFLFAIRYDVPDQFMFFLPFYAMVSVLAGLGLAWVRSVASRARLVRAAAAGVLLTPVVYAVAPAAWQRAGLPLPGRKDLPYRHPAAYWLTPWKHAETSAETFARTALRRLPPGATLVADSTSLYPLRWVREAEGLGRRLRLLPLGRAGPAAVPHGTRDVFVVSDRPGYCPPHVLAAAMVVWEPRLATCGVRWRRDRWARRRFRSSLGGPAGVKPREHVFARAMRAGR